MEFWDACHHTPLHLHTVGCRPWDGNVQPRSVHGIAAADHSMREQSSSLCNGREVLNRSGGDGRGLHCCRPTRHPPAHRHCAGTVLEIFSSIPSMIFSLLLPFVQFSSSSSSLIPPLIMHVQAALPQGIVPFVFAKEYNVHPDILSTAWVCVHIAASSSSTYSISSALIWFSTFGVCLMLPGSYSGC